MPRTGRIWLPAFHLCHSTQAPVVSLDRPFRTAASAAPCCNNCCLVLCQHLNLSVPPLTLKDLLTTALDLMKLEKIEFSGIKGKTLGQQVLDMYEEFQEAYKVFAEQTYDCLELTNTVGGTSLQECQQHVRVSKAAGSSAMESCPTPSQLLPPCYDLICHCREQGSAGLSCRDLGVLAGLYLAYLASSGT